MHHGTKICRRTAAAAAAAVLVGSLAVAEEVDTEALGAQQQVNSYTTGSQDLPRVATAADGRFVVVWQSFGSPGSDDDDFSVQAQRFDENGVPLGGQFQVNSGTGGAQYYPDIGMAANGDFVVVWTSETSAGSDSSFASVQGQRYAADGSPLGGEFQVNSFTTDVQYRARVGRSSAGDFVVTWLSYGSPGTDGYGYSVQAQRFDAAGVPIAGQFQVNSDTLEGEYFAEMGVGPAGDFIITWEAAVTEDEVRAQRYTSDGVPDGGEFAVSSITTNYQSFPSAAIDSDGGFVVAWTSLTPVESDPDGESVQARRFNAAGAPLGDDFLVNSYTTGGQSRPSVAIDESDRVTIVWQSAGSAGDDADGSSVQWQRYAADGTAIGSEFQVNSYTTGDQVRASVAAGPADEFVVAWRSNGSPGDDIDRSVQMRTTVVETIFEDGFESGDTSAWSNTVP